MDENVQDLLAQGAELMGLKKFAEAEERFRAATQAAPREVECYINIGNALMSQDKNDEGIEAFKKALLIDEDNDEVLLSLGFASFANLDYANAVKYFNQVEKHGAATSAMYSIEAAMFVGSEDYNMAVRSINKAIKLEPLNVGLRFEKAQVYEAAGKIDEAAGTLHELQELLPDEGMAYTFEAQLLMDVERYDDAIKVLDGVVERFPSDPTASVLRARALNSMDRYDEALAEAMRGSNLEQDDVRVGLDLTLQTGIALAGLGRADESFAVLERAAREHPSDNADVLFLLLNECVGLKRYDKAIQYADRILAMDDQSPRVEAAAVYYKPLALERLGRMDEARPLYQEATRRLRQLTIGRPALFEVYAYRVMTHNALGEYDDALDLAHYLIELDDASAASHALAYQVLKSKGDAAEAASERAKALALDPGFEFGD